MAAEGGFLRAEAVWAQVPECRSVAGVAAADSPNEPNDDWMPAPALESGSPWHTCTVGTHCRNAAGPLRRRHTPGSNPGPHLPEDQPLPRWQRPAPHFQRQRRSKHPKLLPTLRRRSLLPPGFHWRSGWHSIRSGSAPTDDKRSRRPGKLRRVCHCRAAP